MTRTLFPAPRVFALAALGLFATGSALGATCTWTGGSVTGGQWSDPSNWNNCGGAHPVPVDGDSLVFPAGAGHLANQNDLVGLDLVQITFTGPNYFVTDNGVTVSAGVTSDANMAFVTDVGPVIALPITLAGNAALSCNGNLLTRVNGTLALAGFDLTVQSVCDIEINAALDGAGALVKQGAGTLAISANGSHTGTTQVLGGVLTLRANPGSTSYSVASGSALFVETDSTFNAALQLNGTGTSSLGTLMAYNSVPTWAGPITLSGGARVEVDGSALLTLSGAVGGSDGLTKTGVGQLVIAGSSNTYTGATTLSAGAMRVSSNGGLGAAGAQVTVNDGTTLELDSGVYAGRPLQLAGAGQLGIGSLRALGADVVWSGPLLLSDAVTLGGQLNASLLLSGVVSGPGSLTHAGLNELILSANNTYAGVTQINAGTLQIRHDHALGASAAGTVVSAGGSLALGGSRVVLFEPLVLDGLGAAGSPTLNNLDSASDWTGPITLGSNVAIDTGPVSLGLGQVQGAGGLQKVGSGALFHGGNNTYAGPTLVVDGALYVDHPNALGIGGSSAAGTEVLSGATLALGAVTVSDEYLTLSGSGSNDIGSLYAASGLIIIEGFPSISRWNGPVDMPTIATIGGSADSELTLAGVVSGNGGGLYKRGEGKLILSGANTYTGTTIVFDGALRMAHDQALGDTSGSTTVGFGGQLELAGPLSVGSESLSLLGTGPGGAGALLSTGLNSWAGEWVPVGPTTIAVTSGSLALVGGVQNDVALTKIGAGTLSYGGASAYTGTTTVNQGVLNVLAGASAEDVVVNATGTLSGAGNVGDVTLNSGGTVAPTGTLGASNLLWNGGEIDLRLGPTALDSDRLALAGSLSKGAGPDYAFQFTDAPAGPPAAGVSYALVGYASSSFETGDFQHRYNDLPGPNSLPGTIVVDLTQLTFVPSSVSMFRDGFETP